MIDRTASTAIWLALQGDLTGSQAVEMLRLSLEQVRKLEEDKARLEDTLVELLESLGEDAKAGRL